MLLSEQSPAAAGDAVKKDVYMSEDRDLQLRQLAPEQCRACQYLMVKDSSILGRVVMDCGAVDQRAVNGAILASVLIRLANCGPCPHRTAI